VDIGSMPGQKLFDVVAVDRLAAVKAKERLIGVSR